MFLSKFSDPSEGNLGDRKQRQRRRLSVIILKRWLIERRRCGPRVFWNGLWATCFSSLAERIVTCLWEARGLFSRRLLGWWETFCGLQFTVYTFQSEIEWTDPSASFSFLVRRRGLPNVMCWSYSFMLAVVWLKAGDTVCTPFVRPSVCPSIRPSRPALFRRKKKNTGGFTSKLNAINSLGCCSSVLEMNSDPRHNSFASSTLSKVIIFN